MVLRWDYTILTEYLKKKIKKIMIQLYTSLERKVCLSRGSFSHIGILVYYKVSVH